MPYFSLPPGAWLSGPARDSTSLHPDPPGSSHHPDPPLAGLHPDPPLVGWHPDPPRPASSGRVTNADASRLATAGDPALLALALRKVRNAIVRPVNPRALPPAAGRVREDAEADAFFRWQSTYRMKAVEAELLGRLVVDQNQLWWVPPPSAPRGVAQPVLSFTLTPPNPAFPWDDQIDKVLRAACERDDRLPEILSQAQDFGVFLDAITGIDHLATDRLSELLEVAWDVTTHVVMAFKHSVAAWRPVQRSEQVQPVIPTPGHGSLPSGHATMATVASGLLTALLYEPGDERARQLDRLARRIAFNRVVAGVHFPLDSRVGYELGQQITDLLIAAAGQAPLPPAWSCNTNVGPTDLPELGEPAPRPAPVAGAEVNVASPLFQRLWVAAKAELKLLRI